MLYLNNSWEKILIVLFMWFSLNVLYSISFVFHLRTGCLMRLTRIKQDEKYTRNFQPLLYTFTITSVYIICIAIARKIAACNCNLAVFYFSLFRIWPRYILRPQVLTSLGKNQEVALLLCYLHVLTCEMAVYLN